jgi:CubicO group peptidase (beta-lactamase class C family)
MPSSPASVGGQTRLWNAQMRLVCCGGHSSVDRRWSSLGKGISSLPLALSGLLDSDLRASKRADLPSTGAPGQKFDHSNLSSHLLAIVAARACDQDLRCFAEEQLFDPLGIDAGEWAGDRDGYHHGHAELRWTAKGMPRFVPLYRDEGQHGEVQILPRAWVDLSLEAHSEDAWCFPAGASCGSSTPAACGGLRWRGSGAAISRGTMEDRKSTWFGISA